MSLVGTMRKNKTKIPPEFLPSRKRSDESSVFGFDAYLTHMSQKSSLDGLQLKQEHFIIELVAL